MQNLTMDFNSKIPLYEQLYRFIAGQIQSGRLRENEKLPSKRDLCAHLQISQSTVETAYDILLSEGYIRSVPRSGYYVCSFILPDKAKEPVKRPLIFEESGKEDYQYVFSTSAVDTSVFPYASWAKLNRDTIYNNPALLQRGDKQGDKALRDALCAFLCDYRGVSCTPEQIIVGAGMEYLIGLIIGLFDREQVFALEDPGYETVYRTLLNHDRKIAPIGLDDYGMGVDSLRASGASIAYVTPSHQFPMGMTMPVSRRAQLLKWASESEQRYIIEDDYDSEFRYSSRTIPAMQGLDENGKVIYIGTFNRSIAPSIRVAYLILPDRLLERYQNRYNYASSTVSRFEQQALSGFISQGLYARHLRRTGNLYRQRHDYLIGLLSDIPGAEISGSDAGLHFLLTVKTHSEEALVQKAAQAGVMVHGLSRYCHGSVPVNPSTLVLGFAGLEEKQMKEAVEALMETWA